MKNQIIFGVTGNIATGKTYACRMFSGIAKERRISFHHIDVDKIRRHILLHSLSKKNKEIRKILIKKLNLKNNNKNFEIDGLTLGEKIFSDKKAMTIYKAIINNEIVRTIESKIKKLNGIIAIEWAMLIEDNLLSLAGNNIVLVTCGKEIQKMRLINSDLPKAQLEKRIKVQSEDVEKINKILKQQKEEGKGKLFIFNTTKSPQKSEYEKFFTKLIEFLKDEGN